jgi:hypothetical protein
MTSPKYWCASAFALLGLLSGVEAQAAPGDHVRFGSAEFTPSLTLGATWRSNNYLSPGIIAAQSPQEEDKFAVRPGTHLTVIPAIALDVDASRVKYGLTAFWEGRKFLKPELSNLDRWRNSGLRSQLAILPQAVVGVKLENGFNITGREADAVNSEDAYISQLTSANRLALTIRPGASMEIDVGGLFNAQRYDVPPGYLGGANANLNNRLGYGAYSDFRWRFLPKTAIVARAEYERFDWAEQEVATNADGNTEVGGTIDVYDGSSFLVEGGLRGRFTERLVIGAVVGYTGLYYQAPTEDTGGCSDPSDGSSADLNGFPCALHGNVEVAVDITERQRIRTGYLRQHQDVFFTNYVTMDRVYLGYNGNYGKYVSLNLMGDYALQAYKGDVLRDDNWFRIRSDVTTHATAWMDVGVGVWYTGRRALDAAFATSEYDDVNVHGTIKVFY